MLTDGSAETCYGILSKTIRSFRYDPQIRVVLHTTEE